MLQIGSSAGGANTINAGIAAQLKQIAGVQGDGTLSPDLRPEHLDLNWQYAAKRTIYYPAVRVDYNLSDSLRLNVSYTQTKTVFPGANAATFPGGIDPIGSHLEQQQQ